jgi:hypothetical protein
MGRATYPLLFKLCIDVFPMQASAVPCERVFSSAAETDTKRRNRLSSALMEVLQILKFVFSQDRMDFVAPHLATEDELLATGTVKTAPDAHDHEADGAKDAQRSAREVTRELLALGDVDRLESYLASIDLVEEDTENDEWAVFDGFSMSQ